MFHEGTEGNYTYTGGHENSAWLGFAFIIFIIFAIFAFVFLRNERRHEGGGNLAEAIAVPLAMNAANLANNNSRTIGCQDYMWDHARDDLKEFGEIKKEIVVQTLGQSRELDEKFHQVLRKQSEDTAAIKAEMNQKFFELAKENWLAENARLRDELLKKEINTAKPMFSYEPPKPMYSANPYGFAPTYA